MGKTEAIYRASPPWFQTFMLNVYATGVEVHRYGPQERSRLAQLRRQERWSAEQLLEFQNGRLREIVAHAYAHSPYYRRILDGAGVDPARFRGVADLHRIPLLTKETIRAMGPELQTRKRPGFGWLHGHTSGTTGTPLGLWYDRQTCIVNNAVDARQKMWGGRAQSEWVGLFLGRVVVPLTQVAPPFWRANHIQKQLWFSSFHMSDHTLERYVDEIRRRGLRFLEGYPSTLYILASFVRRSGKTLPMKATFSSSETLHRIQREVIEEAFAAPLFDYYGMAERVAYAGECEEHTDKHVAEEFGYVEICGEDGRPVPDGQQGWIVGTSLWNTAMPMIRYRTSDVSAIVPGSCKCGRAHRRIRSVTTKAEDVVVTPDGRVISASVLTHPFKPIDGLRKSQIIQETVNHVVVKIVPGASLSDADRQQLLDGLQTRLGPDVRIEIVVVDDIPAERSGKYRWVISKVPHRSNMPWEQPS